MGALLSELQMTFTECPDILPLVQSVFNNDPSPQYGNIFTDNGFHGMRTKCSYNDLYTNFYN